MALPQQLPKFTTSFVAFRTIIEKCGGDVNGFSVLVFSSTFESSLWGLNELCVSSQGAPKVFKIGPGTEFVKQSRQPKPKVVLPFGLKHETKKRRQTGKGEKVTKPQDHAQPAPGSLRKKQPNDNLKQTLTI